MTVWTWLWAALAMGLIIFILWAALMAPRSAETLEHKITRTLPSEMQQTTDK